VQLDGREIRADSTPDTAEMLVAVPAGHHQIQMRFQRTRDRTAGDAISAFSAVGLLGFAWGFRRRRASQ
jgi:uncharacterized protein (TIGR03382 family)